MPVAVRLAWGLSLLLLVHTAAAQEPDTQVVPPKLLHLEATPYPSLKNGPAEPGPVTVVLRLEIDGSGAVAGAELAQSAGEPFDALALAAARKFLFSPATQDGKAVSVSILFKYVFTPPEPEKPAPLTNLTGRVYQRWTKEPLNGVRVEVRDLAVHTTTDADGNFSFEGVPPGDYEIVVSGDQLVAATFQQRVNPDTNLDLRLGMEPEEESIPELDEVDDTAVVRATRLRKEVVETTVRREQAERVPGTQGDVVKVVQALGGVARPAAGAGDIVVWGASPSETSFYIDWIPVPRLFHFGGVRSIVPSDFVESLTLVPGGFGADYGRAIGGLVRVETAQPPPDGESAHKVRATVDAIDAGLGASSTVGSDTWTTTSVRRSLIGWSFDRFAPERAEELIPVGDYWDYQAKAYHHISKQSTAEFVLVGADNRATRGIPSIDADQAFEERAHESFHRIGARLTKQQSDGATTSIAPWMGVDRNSLDQYFTDLDVTADEQRLRGGVRLEDQRRVASFLRLQHGLDLEYDRTSSNRRGALTLPAREGDVTVFGQGPGDRVNVDEWKVSRLGIGAYGSALFELFDGRCTIEPALRFEPSILSGDRVLPVRPTEPEVGYTDLQLVVDPRLRITYTPATQASFYAAAGRYHQPPAAEDLSPVFGNPVLDQPEAIHALTGVRLTPNQSLQFEYTLFWERQHHLTVRSQLPTPPTAQLLTSEGEGRNFGAQATLRLRLSERFLAWASYSLMRAERKDHSDDPWRLSDFDQTHIGQAMASFDIPHGFELGARVQVSSGFPRTPVVGTSYNTRTGAYDPVFGQQNSTRLPTFFEASIRVGWRADLSWGRLRTWLDVQNATNHDNPEEIIYTSDYSEHGYVQGLPIFPVLGVEVCL